jgi:hypothetical protein
MTAYWTTEMVWCMAQVFGRRPSWAARPGTGPASENLHHSGRNSVHWAELSDPAISTHSN